MIKDQVQKIKNLRKNKKFSISVAESCTGGMISANLTNINGSSLFFNGSIISYSNKFKNDYLAVPIETLKNYGAVSHQTAKEMVKGLQKKSKSEILISVTGVAGPKGGSSKTPVGCIFFGVGSKLNSTYKIKTIKKNFKEKTRRQIQRKSTEFALKLIISEISKI